MTDSHSIATEPGTYALMLVPTAVTIIEVGKLGEMEVKPGYYVYVGSAAGPGGLRARVSRHLRDTKRVHWHIDYLRDVAAVEEVWLTSGLNGAEHQWAKAFANMSGGSVPLPGFGSSDCRCSSHLFHFSRRPESREFQIQLGANMGRHTVVSVPELGI